MSRRQALLLSSSNCHGYSILQFAKDEICAFLNSNKVKELLFVPYAQKEYDSYTTKIKNVFEPWGFNVTGIHTYPVAADAINQAKAVFIGGGNTFQLLKTLYDQNLVNLIRKRVDEGSLIYMGSSAGTNVATVSIHTTNDMPITYPPSFDAIGIVPFNINPHYIDQADSPTHKGETRDQRICEYIAVNHIEHVLGLKEGSLLFVNGDQLIIKGVAGAVLFDKNGCRTDFPVGADVSYLCNN